MASALNGTQGFRGVLGDSGVCVWLVVIESLCIFLAQNAGIVNVRVHSTPEIQHPDRSDSEVEGSSEEGWCWVR